MLGTANLVCCFQQTISISICILCCLGVADVATPFLIVYFYQASFFNLVSSILFFKLCLSFCLSASTVCLSPSLAHYLCLPYVSVCLVSFPSGSLYLECREISLAGYRIFVSLTCFNRNALDPRLGSIYIRFLSSRILCLAVVT